MSSYKRFEAICQAMSHPAFYPHAVDNLKRIDTHISSVFLTGEWVYKLKKPVYLDFLDFRQLEQRKEFCGQELDLNRRLSHGIYHTVVEIFESENGRFSLQGNGRIVDYAVKMRQLPDSASLKALLREGKVGQRQMETLAQTLAAFYQKGRRNHDIDHFGRPDVISYNMEENFRQLKPFIGEVLVKEKWNFLCRVSCSFLDHHRGLFERRVKEGHVRDGHGDLRADHIYFYEGIQIIDCIEFNDRFRYGDAAVDLAFLYMDLEHLGYPEWSRFFISSYVTAANDPELYTLIDFYAAYRAIVRLKIDIFRYKEAESKKREFLKQDALLYLEQAYRYAIRFARPTLWVLCGLPATGKSSLGKALSKVLSIDLFQSDRVRKTSRITGGNETEPFGQGSYRLGLRHKVYNELLNYAHETLKTGHSVILDATFSRRKWRDEARRLANDLDTNLIFVEAVCKEDTIRARLKSREEMSGLSDARLDHLPDMLENFEPIVELPNTTHFKISSQEPPEPMLIKTLSKGFDRKRRQVIQLLGANI